MEILIGLHKTLYLNGRVTATTLSITIATVMLLLILSDKRDNLKNGKAFNRHAVLGQNNSPHTNTISMPRAQRVIVSATARPLKNFDDVVNSFILQSTIRLNMFPRIPDMMISGLTTQNIMDLSTIAELKTLAKFGAVAMSSITLPEVFTRTSRISVICKESCMQLWLHGEQSHYRPKNSLNFLDLLHYRETMVWLFPKWHWNDCFIIQLF